MKHIWRIIKETRSIWRYYFGISIFTILLAATSQLIPLFTKGAIDQVTKLASGGQANVKLVAVFAILIFLADIGQTIFSNIGGYLGDIMAAKLRQVLSRRYYRHLLSLPQHYFDTELSGKIINRLSRGITQIGDFMQMMSNNFLQFIFSTIFSLIIVAYYSWQVALMLLALYPIFIWMTARTSNKWQKYQHKINNNLDIASGRFAEAIGQIKVIKSFIQEVRELKFFNKHIGIATKTTMPQSKYWHWQDMRRRTVLNVIFLAVFAYIFVGAAQRQFTVGEMVLLIQYSMLIRIPIFSISFLVDRTQRAIADSKDYFKAMDEKPEITDSAGAKPLNVTKGEITYENVSFAYDNNELDLREVARSQGELTRAKTVLSEGEVSEDTSKEEKPFAAELLKSGDERALRKSSFVLKGLNFTIQPDSKVALVGESGEGKTTVTNLLMRLYDLQKGQILIDGHNISTVTQESLRRQIGVVFQDPALFSGTVYENISYANPLASKKEVITAAKDANAHEFIEKFENGYDTQIGERGLKLSGGQKQRIAIARALLKNAPILILDEATSSLDSKSEAMVQEALGRLMKGRTTIIIAHRLSTIQNVDKIITINNGKVDEIGSPEELAISGGIYDQLIKLQRGHSEAKEKKLKEFEITS